MKRKHHCNRSIPLLASFSVALSVSALFAQEQQAKTGKPFLAQLADEITQFERDQVRLQNAIYTRLRSCQGIVGRRDSVDHRTTFGCRQDPTHEEEALMIAAGRIRAESCADLLLNRISWQQKYDLTTGAELPNLLVRRHIVYWSLCDIGQHAAERALIRLPLEDDTESRKLMICLIRNILGNEATRQRLEALARAPAQTDKPEHQQRLAEAIDFIVNISQCNLAFE